MNILKCFWWGICGKNLTRLPKYMYMCKNCWELIKGNRDVCETSLQSKNLIFINNTKCKINTNVGYSCSQFITLTLIYSTVGVKVHTVNSLSLSLWLSIQLSVLGRCQAYREFSYSEMTENGMHGPTPGVHIVEVSIKRESIVYNAIWARYTF